MTQTIRPGTLVDTWDGYATVIANHGEQLLVELENGARVLTDADDVDVIR